MEHLSLKGIRLKRQLTEIMKQTNITVEMVYITPNVAKEYLRFNTGNRIINRKNSLFIINQMKEGAWMENGESIIFDDKNELKDGQHRLNAIIETGNSYWFPVVRGVKSIAMSTIDTGKNRNASDVLYLNGFKNTNSIASYIAIIHKYAENKSKSAYGSAGASGKSTSVLTNQQTLEYCQKHYEKLNSMNSKVSEIYTKQTIKVFSKSTIFICLYLIAGFNPTEKHYEFASHLCGVNKDNGSAPDYLFKKVLQGKLKKEPLNFYWILGMSIRAWNYFIDGNPAINHFSFKVDSELPIPYMRSI